MSFIYPPDLFIYTLITAFICFYGVYLIRMYKISRATGKRINTLIYKFVLRAAYFLLLVVSLMGPLLTSPRSARDMKKNIYLAIDLSGSMAANDPPPSRFEACRENINEFIQRTREARIGIIIFSSDAFLHAPLTSDKKALQTYVDILNPDILENKGSDLNAPIELALRKFRQTGEPASNNIILFSDGESHTPVNNKLLKTAQKENVRVYTVGIGSREGGILTIKGANVLTRLQPDLLKDIAAQTHAQYIEYSVSSSDVASLMNFISKRKEPIENAENNAESNKYFYFLMIALYLMMLDAAITLNILSL